MIPLLAYPYIAVGTRATAAPATSEEPQMVQPPRTVQKSPYPAGQIARLSCPQSSAATLAAEAPAESPLRPGWATLKAGLRAWDYEVRVPPMAIMAVVDEGVLLVEEEVALGVRKWDGLVADDDTKMDARKIVADDVQRPW